jgi:type II restriction/modification system DNA methylase subunit YeeA
LEVLRCLFAEPDKLRPEATAARVTEDAAEKFSCLAESIELDGADPRRGKDPHRVAHFLMRLLFCLFADSIGLLPKHMFREMIETDRLHPQTFQRKLRALFQAMSGRGNSFGPYDIHFFNGGLFDDDEVLALNSADMGILYSASRLDWSTIEPSIFGTLFERSLNAQKRSQIGAHYTSPADIALIVEPVIIVPLRRRWDEVQARVTGLAAEAEVAPKGQAYNRLRRRMEDAIAGWMEQFENVRVLDPACGSGNFLYIALRRLLDLWWEASCFAAAHGLATILPRPVNPRQLYGIETDYYAHELASIVVWIGYLQWRHEHGMGEPKEPILEKLTNIEHTDAVLRYTDDRKPYEPEWPVADFIIGNPPFLGGNKIRQELGDEYVDDLFHLYEGRVPAFADLVCYWFEKSRAQIAIGKTQRAGLLGTQGIRGGVNRVVLEKIKSSGDIFLAFSDRDWILDGANVHVSIVGFDDGSQTDRSLDGSPVTDIHANLTSEANMVSAGALPENANLCFMGPSPKGAFDIDSETARKMLMAPLNVNGRPNSDVVRPVRSGVDLVQRNRHKSTIDFGMMSMEKAANYEYPFEYVKAHVYPVRTKGRKAKYGEHWWRYGRPRVEMRRALIGKSRYIATPATAKHRIFVWERPEVLCNQGTLVFARDDDYFFGVLHSQLHEAWARQMGTQLREVESGFRYTPTSTFETFPFPWPPGQEPTDNSHVIAIASAARALVRLRDAWLEPPDATPTELKKRTLTNLYNTRPVWLENAHETLDRAVFAAYGLAFPLDNSEILRQLLVLNHERAVGHVRAPSLGLPPKKAPAVERLPHPKPAVKVVTR